MNRHQPLQACLMSLYPSHDSLVDAVAYIESQAPIHPNEVFTYLMHYHNTLIQEIQRDAHSPPRRGEPQLTRIK